MTTDILLSGIKWARKNAYDIVIVYPDKQINHGLYRELRKLKHKAIISSNIKKDTLPTSAIIKNVIFKNIKELTEGARSQEANVSCVCTINDLCDEINVIPYVIETNKRTNLIIEVPSYLDDDIISNYEHCLDYLLNGYISRNVNIINHQLNILTDRILLKNMRNCGAGINSISLFPNGKIYSCPAFYYHGFNAVGDNFNPLVLSNYHLYQLEHALVCSSCDAWQCRRCLFNNKIKTRELNTPSFEQCIISHLEREASRKLWEHLKFMPIYSCLSPEIPILNYLDPFEKVKNINYTIPFKNKPTK